MGNVKIATYSDTCKNLEEKIDVKELEGKAVVRLGGTMNYSEYPIQINNKHSVQGSVNKAFLHMVMRGRPFILPFIAKYGINNCISSCEKEGFMAFINEIDCPAYIVKPLDGSGGEDIQIVTSKLDLSSLFFNNNGKSVIATPFVNVTSEYRFFCTNKEVFYIYKKVRKKDNKNDLFITRKNHIIYPLDQVVKPRLLAEMKEAALEVMNKTGLEIAALDIIYDSSNNDNHKFYIVETNTGPEISNKQIGDLYVQKIKELILDKLNNKNNVCAD